MRPVARSPAEVFSYTQVLKNQETAFPGTGPAASGTGRIGTLSRAGLEEDVGREPGERLGVDLVELQTCPVEDDLPVGAVDAEACAWQRRTVAWTANSPSLNWIRRSHRPEAAGWRPARPARRGRRCR